MDINEKLKHVETLLKNGGYHISDGIKFGVDFLIYEDRKEKVHSKYALLIERDDLSFRDLIMHNRVALSAKKILILYTKDGQFKKISLFK